MALARPTVEPTAEPRSFHLLAKPTGAVCNLDCSYCFFLSKELLYPGSRFRMAEDLLEEYLRQLVQAHRDEPVVVVAFQGGEPTLMGIEFFRHATRVVRTLLAPGQQVEFTIQTNATLIDEQWATFLRDEGFLVGVSIDGPRDLHDAYRVNRGGRGSHDQVMRGLGQLRAHDVQWNVLTTVHAANAEHGLETYRFLRDECGARFMQFIPIVERVTASGAGDRDAWSTWRDRSLYRQQGVEVTNRSVRAAQYGRFLVDVFEEWVRHDIGSVFVQSFDVALASWAGEAHGLCVHSETCGSALALEHTGDVYCCDHFVEPDYLLGNIAETHLVDLVASERQSRFGTDKLTTLPSYCVSCDVRFACHGGCPKDRFVTTPNGDPGLNYLCEGYQRIFRHMDRPMKAMTMLLRQGRAPAELMQVYARHDAERPADAPCTCDGDRSWGTCHGALR